MAHHVHKTQGLVLQSFSSREANSFLIIFTRELGLITCTAQGSRYLKSKLRYGIQKYDASQFSFVYGKYSWRLTNAVPKYNVYYEFKDTPETLRVIANTYALLQRLLTGEEKNTELFDLVTNGLSFLKTAELSSDELKYFEFLFVLRILHNLGYISGSSGLEVLAVGSGWTKEALVDVSSYKREAVTAINRAIVESQL